MGSIVVASPCRDADILMLLFVLAPHPPQPCDLYPHTLARRTSPPVHLLASGTVSDGLKEYRTSSSLRSLNPRGLSAHRRRRCQWSWEDWCRQCTLGARHLFGPRLFLQLISWSLGDKRLISSVSCFPSRVGLADLSFRICRLSFRAHE